MSKPQTVDSPGWCWLWNAVEYERRVQLLAESLRVRYPGWIWNGRWPIMDLIDVARSGDPPRWMQLSSTGCMGFDPDYPTRWVHIVGVAFNPNATVDMAAMRTGWRLLWHCTRRAGRRAAGRALQLLRVVDDPLRLADRLDSWIGIRLYSEHDRVRGKKTH